MKSEVKALKNRIYINTLINTEYEYLNIYII